MANTLEGTLASIPGFGGYLAKKRYDEQRDAQEVAQAHGLMQIIGAVQKQQTEQATRQALMESGGNPSVAIERAIKAGNAQVAHALAPVAKEWRERQLMDNVLKGGAATGVQDDADRLEAIGTQLSAAGHPGGATLMQRAERLRKLKADAATLKTMQSQPVAPVQSANEGELIQSTEGKAFTNPDEKTVPLEERAAFDAALNQARSQNAAARGEAGGMFSTLMKSENPQIAAEAKMLQVSMDKADPRSISPQWWQQQQTRLAQADANFQQQKLLRGFSGPSGGPAVGAPGSHMMQDPDTGKRYMVNERTGTAHELNDDGTWNPTPVNSLPKKLVRVGNIGTAGARENVFTQRMIQAGNQVSKDLENVAQMPIRAQRGVFGTFGAVSAPNMLDATKAALGNKLTSEESQIYQAMATGFQRGLAAIEAAGLMPGVNLSHMMDAVVFKPGDTQMTKLHKLAQVRQIVDSGMEIIIANPRISDMEKDAVRKIMERTEKAIPFTHTDLIQLGKRQQENPSTTLRQVIGKVEKEKSAKLPLKNANGWDLHEDAKGNRAYVGPNGEVEEVK